VDWPIGRRSTDADTIRANIPILEVNVGQKKRCPAYVSLQQQRGRVVIVCCYRCTCTITRRHVRRVSHPSQFPSHNRNPARTHSILPHHALSVPRSIITQTSSELVKCVKCKVRRVRCEDPYSQIELAVSSIGNRSQWRSRWFD